MLGFRVGAQEIDAAGPRRDAAILDLGVQDTGPDGARWALALRGVAVPAEDLVMLWTLRGAPHVYRRAEVAGVAAAVAPVSEADAAKRVFDAAKPLRDAGIPVLDALDRMAAEMWDLAAEPLPKGEMSRRVTERLPEPYLRWCRVCRATHPFEQTFRLAASRGGLELEPGTSPPVLRRIPGWDGPAAKAPPHLDLVRGVLRLLGPTTPKRVAEFLDSPVRDVQARWPEDTVPVEVDTGSRVETLEVLASDADALRSGYGVDGVVRLLGPFDLLLQTRDRELLVPDEKPRKDLWRTIGRPGGVLVDDELLGSWRPRASGRRLRLAVALWDEQALPDGVEAEAERLAAFRGVEFAGFA